MVIIFHLEHMAVFQECNQIYKFQYLTLQRGGNVLHPLSPFPMRDLKWFLSEYMAHYSTKNRKKNLNSFRLKKLDTGCHIKF